MENRAVTSLTEFLRREAEERRTRWPDAERETRGWAQSVGKLVLWMQQELTRADTERVLEVRQVPRQVREKGVGAYDVPGLSVSLGLRLVEVIPIARNVVARFDPVIAPSERASGLIDLTNGTLTFRLYRFLTDEGETWKIVDPLEHSIKDFGQEAFEEAMQRLL